MESRTEVDRIIGQVKRAFEGDSWHGDNLTKILERLDHSIVFQEAYPNGNSIWTLVGHLATWFDVAIRRLDGETYDPPRDKDFPVTSRADRDSWETQRKILVIQYEAFLSRLEVMTDKDLDLQVSGVGYPAYILLHGIVQHLLYHAGQIAIISKVLEDRLSVGHI